MANQLREWIQNDVINPLGAKAGLTGTLNASQVKQTIENIITSEDSNNIIKSLVQPIKSSANIILPAGITTLRDKAIYLYDAKSPVNIYLPDTINDLTLGVPIFSDGNYALSQFNVYYNGDINSWININRYSSTLYTLTNKSYYLYCNNTLVTNLNLTNQTINECCFAYTILENVNINNAILKNQCFYYSSIKNLIFNEGFNSLDNTNIFYGLNYNASDYCNVSFSSSITKIGQNCFANSRINYLNIPEGVSEIGTNAFNNTILISNIVYLPSTLTKIDRYGFQCRTKTNGKITYVLKATTPPVIDNYSFYPTSYIAKIYVPKGYSSTYKSATNWSSLASYIFEFNTITFNIDSSLLNNENVLYSIDGGAEQEFTQASFTGENLATLRVTSKSADVVVKVGTTQGGSEIGTVANASTTFTFESDTTIYITKQ